jgi:hypothetical protein
MVALSKIRLVALLTCLLAVGCTRPSQPEWDALGYQPYLTFDEQEDAFVVVQRVSEDSLRRTVAGEFEEIIQVPDDKPWHHPFYRGAETEWYIGSNLYMRERAPDAPWEQIAPRDFIRETFVFGPRGASYLKRGGVAAVSNKGTVTPNDDVFVYDYLGIYNEGLTFLDVSGEVITLLPGAPLRLKSHGFLPEQMQDALGLERLRSDPHDRQTRYEMEITLASATGALVFVWDSHGEWQKMVHLANGAVREVPEALTKYRSSYGDRTVGLSNNIDDNSIYVLRRFDVDILVLPIPYELYDVKTNAEFAFVYPLTIPGGVLSEDAYLVNLDNSYEIRKVTLEEQAVYVSLFQVAMSPDELAILNDELDLVRYDIEKLWQNGQKLGECRKLFSTSD